MHFCHGVPQVYAHHGVHSIDVAPDAHQNGEVALTSNGVHQNSKESGSKSGNAIKEQRDGIVDLRSSRSDQVFATITRNNLQIWSTKPIVVLATLDRSEQSITTYGENVAVFFRPDTTVIVLQTSNSYLLTYSLDADPSARVLQQQLDYSQSRRQSVMRTFGTNDAAGFGEIILNFRRAIKFDAGINAAFALDSELVVATIKPAALQCIRWDPSKTGGPNASAQLLSKMDWMEQKSPVRFMIYDRAMNLSVWLVENGSAYAVQRVRPQIKEHKSSDDNLHTSQNSTASITRLFDGYCFHAPRTTSGKAILAAINARFSLIAIATEGGELLCYTAKDYAGNVPLSHSFRMAASSATTGRATSISWSPDGYCLFAGFERGWAMWSVFGRAGSSSFTSNGGHALSNGERWLLDIQRAAWVSGGAEILLTCKNSGYIWKLELSRSAASGTFSCANLVRALLQSPTELAVYCGHEMPDLTSFSNEASLWHRAQYPAAYLHNQWPIRATVVSQDGRYVAIAGRRGLATYSLTSSRWKTFLDPSVENSFAVRGGMCWFNHILAVATENADGYDLRLYSRDYELGRTNLFSESFSMPIAFIGPSGEDSLLVYTYENVLYHYVINFTQQGAQLMQVGQIAFHGVIRAPSRVRSVSWVLPDHQLRNGDPARDVEHAALLFLLDDKLVLLQPHRAPDDEIKYDMRVIAQHVEYYILMRDQIYFNLNDPVGESISATPSPGGMQTPRNPASYSLRDSLWIFVGDELRMWTDVRDVIRDSPKQTLEFKPTVITIPVDFYPLSILLNKAVILGIESELLQRRDVSFAQFRAMIRSQLFLPYILRYQLCEVGATPAAFAMANQYQNLSYFPHSLEILLHNILDDEVDRTPDKIEKRAPSTQPIPAVLSFMEMVLSPTAYLQTVVQCIRKTEVSSWKYLFAHMPPPLALFEKALDLKDLKTASGWLIVLYGLEEEDEGQDKAKHEETLQKLKQHIIRLMTLAKQKGDLELCTELARFMIGIDPLGGLLKSVIDNIGFSREGLSDRATTASLSNLSPEALDRQAVVKRQASRGNILQVSPVKDGPRSEGGESDGALGHGGGDDYFSASLHNH